MKNLLLKIEYDGTGFCGWQRQLNARTVQGELEKVLSVLCGQSVVLEGTGRTDAGVHALGQCATFCGDFGIPVERIAAAANAMLSKDRLHSGDIRIIYAQEAPRDFHARFSAVGKTYIYRIFNGTNMPVFLRNYRYNVKKPLDVGLMCQAGRLFVGEHDFAAFMAAGSNLKGSTVRTVYGLHVRQHEAEITISVTGNGFLYNMVRIIAGTLVDIGLGRIKPESTADIIAGCERSKAGHTAPPQGLYMAEVYFDEDTMMAAAENINTL
ncbi:MAG: tRNA pseudouridine(38-40) synthase TruA [Firmicutes bacterium]|nr:tRNA pseudouridine(38-40) synthase TruA [Bacillota bacterium]